MLALTLAPVAAVVSERPVHAQKRDDSGLSSARKLFAEGLKDEESGNFADALEKFRGVAKVKDTVPVRYRIGACLEGLGKLKDAMDAYQAAIDLGAAGGAGAAGTKDLEVVRVAKERTSTLAERIPQLTLMPSEHAPTSSEVRVDGIVVPASDLGRPMALDPGTHAITATAPGASPFETQVTLAERARFSLVVQLDPKPAPAEVAPPPEPPLPVRVTHDQEDGSSRKTVGWISAGIGAAFLVGAGVTLALRQSDISKLEDACPNGACPRSREDELSSVRSRAETEGPIAAVLAGIGVVGVGVGTYLLVTAPHPTRSAGASVRPLGISGRVVPAGGQLVLTTTF